ncbi:MAG: hypothetical protein KC613_20575 [Myxococcales bacterium]|nr:hypothetical protein [Myxococcales bacterium]MCB9526131.1 hypothetical protein [Myxococcales bacterium]
MSSHRTARGPAVLGPSSLRTDTGGNPLDPVALLECQVDLTHRIGLDALPEGIETPGPLALVERIGAASGQGCLLGRPLGAITFGGLQRA